MLSVSVVTPGAKSMVSAPAVLLARLIAPRNEQSLEVAASHALAVAESSVLSTVKVVPAWAGRAPSARTNATTAARPRAHAVLENVIVFCTPYLLLSRGIWETS